MSEEFKVEIINPDKSFLTKEDVTEVVVPAFEGEMGILKDHISIISFLKPGIIKIFSKSGEEKYYIEDGLLEFKNNNLSVLTSSIYAKEASENILFVGHGYGSHFENDSMLDESLIKFSNNFSNLFDYVVLGGDFIYDCNDDSTFRYGYTLQCIKRR